MEFSEARPFGTEGSGRKPTHDLLSLYSHSTAQQDPGPPSQGSYLKTHDFLQPLETKATAKEEAKCETSSVAQNQPLPLPAPPPSVEHILPGGIGTYSISHISYFHNNQRVPKPEASLFNVPQAASTDRSDSNSNCSYTSRGFTLWEESAVKKGKTGQENNVGEKPILGVESASKLGQWTLAEQTSQSLSDNHLASNSLSSLQTTGQKSKSLMDMMKSAEDCSQHDEGLDNEEAFILNRESSNTPRAELRVKVDGKSTDQKPNTPRSKHSATEQRRRSKINDRFHMLRELIPKSDQKRDKASFLLEVIEYIHFLQEKVHKYEGSFQGWNHELERLMQWINNHRPAENLESRGKNSGSGPSPALLFASKIDVNNIAISPTTPRSSQNIETGLSTPTAFKALNQNPGITNKAMPISTCSQPYLFPSTQIGGQAGVVSQLTHVLTSDAENTIYQPSLQCQTYTCSTEVTAASEKLKEKDVNIEGGGTSISSLYSKWLLDTLTQALQKSEVDLSQASLSVQIELGKQANTTPTVPICGSKDDVVPSSNQGTMRSRVSSSEKSDQAVKRLKTSRS